MLRSSRFLTAGLGLLLAVAFSPAQTAHAYGASAVWQIGFAYNCTNTGAGVCPFGLGGSWGWIELDRDGTGDAELTQCSHFIGGPAPGADHFQVAIDRWWIAPGFIGLPAFWISGLLTATGRTGGPPVTIELLPSNTDIPAMAGHFSAQIVFGMTAPPGTNFEIQVTKIS